MKTRKGKMLSRGGGDPCTKRLKSDPKERCKAISKSTRQQCGRMASCTSGYCAQHHKMLSGKAAASRSRSRSPTQDLVAPMARLAIKQEPRLTPMDIQAEFQRVLQKTRDGSRYTLPPDAVAFVLEMVAKHPLAFYRDRNEQFVYPMPIEPTMTDKEAILTILNDMFVLSINGTRDARKSAVDRSMLQRVLQGDPLFEFIFIRETPMTPDM